MHEYVTVSSSSYDPAALASKLTEKSGEGWEVVSIVQTGGDVTAFLRRASGESAAEPAETSDAAAIESAVSEPEPEVAEPEVTTEPEATAEPEPVVVAAAAPLVDAVPTSEPEPVNEPAGWAASPEPTVAAEPEPVVAAAAATEPASTYSPDPTPAATPTPEPVAPVQEPATPAVPAGWYADPSGRYELRYWDGGKWTEHVARGGQQYTDEPVA